MSTRLPQNAVTAQAAILALLGQGESYGKELILEIADREGWISLDGER